MRRARLSTLALTLIGAIGVLTPSSARAKTSDAAKDARLVEYFLKTPVAELPPDAVDYFLKIKPEALPAKLRVPYQAKKLQLQGLKKLYELNTGGPRSAEKTPGCAAINDSGAAMVSVLESENFSEITSSEEQWLIQKTHCQEIGLMCEFTLAIVRQKKAKTEKPRVWRLLNIKDPLFVLLEMKRQGSPDPPKSGSFGESNYPRCR